MNAAVTTVLPCRLLPMLAASSAPFDDPECLFEIKWDGVRTLASVERGTVKLWGREGADYTERYPELEVLSQLPCGTMVDGELVMLRDGRPDFHALMGHRHSHLPSRRPLRRLRLVEPVRYVVFDLLYWGGRSLLKEPFSERRQLLHRLFPDTPFTSLCEGVIGEGKAFFKKVLAAGHEGVVAKQLKSAYSPNGRNGAWKKIKEKIELPCVIIGYRLNGKELRDLQMASLVDGQLAYVCTVELGVDRQHDLVKVLEPLRVSKAAVACSVKARWVQPKLFAKVHFCGWRPGGAWRDPLLVGDVGE